MVDKVSEVEVVAALRRSEAQFRSLIERAPDGVVILQEGSIVLANPTAVRMFGAPDFETVRGRLISEFLTAADGGRALERIGRLQAGEKIQSSEYHVLALDIIVEAHSGLYEYENRPAILTFLRDVTERHRMQKELFRRDRLAALGTMAATLGHEINNPLTYLQLNLERLEREAIRDPDPARAAKLLEIIANAVDGVVRVARIVRDLRAYSRDNSGDPEGPVDVVATVSRALQMVEHELRHRAQLVRQFPVEPAFIDGNAGHLEQVIVNLLVNAMQALPGKPSDQIVVDIAVGDEITIRVRDTGPGIDEPERVFEPFVTTKPTGEGTGLGLSICKQLVELMRGRIEVASTSKHGTTLAVTLPRRHAPVPPPVRDADPASGGRLRILVIDDEAHVRHAIANLLATDHEVEAVGDGECALAMVAAAHYDVILCDLMMPRMNGRDVFEQIRSRWPGRERRIVFITGGAFVPALAGFLSSVDNLKLRKPFTIEHVLALVREAQLRMS